MHTTARRGRWRKGKRSSSCGSTFISKCLYIFTVMWYTTVKNCRLIWNVISVAVWIHLGPGGCHGFSIYSPYPVKVSSQKWNSCCSWMFVSKRGGTQTIFMCYQWTLEIFIALWLTFRQYIFTYFYINMYSWPLSSCGKGGRQFRLRSSNWGKHHLGLTL